MKDAPLYELFRQTSIKTENQLLDFSDSSWQYCPGIGRSIVSYMIFYQGGIIHQVTRVPGPVSQSGA